MKPFLSRRLTVGATLLWSASPIFAQQLPPPASADKPTATKIQNAKSIEKNAADATPARANNSGTLPPPATLPNAANPDDTLIEVTPKTNVPTSDDGVTILSPDAGETALQPRSKQNIKIGGVDVTGLTRDEAVKKLINAHAKRLEQPVVLRLGAREWWTTRTALGASLDFGAQWDAAQISARANAGVAIEMPLKYNWDAQVATQKLHEMATTIDRAPQAIGVDSDGRSTGRGGSELSVGGSLWRIREALLSTPPQNAIELLERDVPFMPQQVRESDAVLAAKALQAAKAKAAVQAVKNGSGDPRFTVLVSNYSTKYNTRLADRTTNLRIAAHEINGTILQPGEVFSTNRAIGPRSTDRGFRAAHIFMGKKVIEGVGGGICQSATTVYNAALKARLPIVERHSHSLPVSYATPNNDATIYWGQKDMRFRNNTNGPLLVRTFLRDGRFHAQIYATR